MGRNKGLKSVCKGKFRESRGNGVGLGRAKGPVGIANGGALLNGTGPSTLLK